MRAGRDLGLRKAHPFSRVPTWVWLAAPALSFGFLAWNFHHNYMKVVDGRIADAKAWKIDGPPCPTGSEAEFLARRYHRGPRRFDYEGVTFFRRWGHVSCAPVYEDGGRSTRFYPVCQFTGPGQLLIRTRKGDWYFSPGPGQPATISAQHGQARCVMASNFTMATVLAEMKGQPVAKGQ
jgi:hypothetical protein